MSILGDDYVVGSQTEFAVKEKCSATGDNFQIKNSDGDVVFRGDGQFFSTREKIILELPDNTPICCIMSKHLSLHGCYYLVPGDSDEVDDKLFTFKPSVSFNAFNALAGKIQVLDNDGEERYYLERKSGLSNKTYGIYTADGEEISEVARDQGFGGWLLDKDHYRVTVPEGRDAAFAIACAMIIDEVREED